MKKLLYSLILILLSFCKEKSTPPAPVLPIPHERQIAWQELGFYGFVHFNMNTFSDREWGYGDESPAQFDPTSLDTRQWARIASEAGMKGLIITAKHHDGFVLWPSEYTEHSVKNSPWKNGKGDLIRELAESCKEYGLKFGVYYSPWDRNHPDYGRPEYVTYMRNQLKELLTNYGDIFEVWFDGANGGSGYYGGTNEERKVDKLTYYEWPSVYELVRELQPNAMMFSDGGPDVRWVGNEDGFAYETTWSNLMRDSVYAGMPEYPEKYASGQENGTHWVPTEADVSIRPGWYYHEYEDHKVKTLPELLEIYYNSVGRNSSLLINFPVDRRGLIHSKDEEAILKFGNKIREDFSDNLASSAKIKATADRGKGYEADKVLDGDYETYWALKDGELKGSLILDFGKEADFNRLLLQEYTPLGQRIKEFSIEIEQNGDWKKIAEGTTVGYKRILRLGEQTAQRLRINFLDAKDVPVISTIGVFNASKLVIPPTFSRSVSGEVTLTSPDDGLEIRYTLDGTEPTDASALYNGPIPVNSPHTLIAEVWNPDTGEKSEALRADLDIPKKSWKTYREKGELAIDENPSTYLVSRDNELVVDLGQIHRLVGFTYTPMQARYPNGIIADYLFEISDDGKVWKRVAFGEFSNIANSPIQQRVRFESVQAKFIKLKSVKTTDGNLATYGELGVLTQ